MTNRFHIAALSLFMAVALGANPASAGTERISLTDYDLSQAGDVDRLHTDIVLVATRHCKEDYRGWSYSMKHRRIDACVEEAVDRTIAEAGILSLAVRHASIDEDRRYETDRATSAGVDYPSEESRSRPIR